MNVERTWVLVMLIAGGLAGLAALGGHPGHRLQPSTSRATAPTASTRITVALLGLGQAARGGARRRCCSARCTPAAPLMQAATGTPVDIVEVLAGADRAVRGGTAADPGHIPAARGPGRGRRGPVRRRGWHDHHRARPRGEGRSRPGQSVAPLAGAGTFTVFGLIDIFVFGLFAHHGDVTFAFSQPFSKVTLPDLSLPAAETCYACGALTIVLAVLRAVREAEHPVAAGDHRRRGVPVRAGPALLGGRRRRPPRSTW